MLSIDQEITRLKISIQDLKETIREDGGDENDSHIFALYKELDAMEEELFDKLTQKLGI